MKINFMMFLVVFSFVGFLGMIIGEHLYQLKMAENGLQECIVAIDTETYETVWQKDCKK